MSKLSKKEYYDKMVIKYPWLKNYTADEVGLNDRYIKACYIYKDILKTKTSSWYDRDFGLLINPEDAFEIWWDI